MKKNIIIGYSGHGFVVCDIFESLGSPVVAYCDNMERQYNPFDLAYLGTEKDRAVVQVLKESNWFVAIGDNRLRQKIINRLAHQDTKPVSIVHTRAIVSKSVIMADGVMCAAGVIINAQVKLGNGVICNTGSIIEHECEIGDFVHIAPGAVLAGNVSVGEGSFIGANAVVKEGVSIGKGVTIGAGSVVIKDVEDGAVVVGNPGKVIKYKT